MNHDELLKLSKTELVTIIEDQGAQLEELTRQVSAQDAALARSGESGWLLTTKNPRYAGVTAGVEFRGGRAFIGDSRPDAEQLAKMLAADFGYKLERSTAREAAGLPVLEPEKIPNADLMQAGVLRGEA